MFYKNALLHNVRAIYEVEDGVKLSRIPDEVRRALNPLARDTMAFNTCGCEIRFCLKGDEARVHLRREQAIGNIEAGMAELYYGPFQAPYGETPLYITKAGTEIVVRRPTNPGTLAEAAQMAGQAMDPRMIRILLPYDTAHVLCDIEGDICPPDKEMAPPRRYLAYGSSISHGGNAAGPSGGYTTHLARMLGADLLNLGFAGSCQMEPALAEYLAGMEWDFATLELGINVIEQWDSKTFCQRAGAFMARVAGAHPARPVYCYGQFINELCLPSHPRHKRLAEYETALRETAAGLALPNLHYIDTRGIVEDWGALSADLIHFSEYGFGRIAQGIYKRMTHR